MMLDIGGGFHSGDVWNVPSADWQLIDPQSAATYTQHSFKLTLIGVILSFEIGPKFETGNLLATA